MTQKKRRQDPGQEKAKEDRRRKRLAKALKKMEKKERQPKPLSECEVFLLKRAQDNFVLGASGASKRSGHS